MNRRGASRRKVVLMTVRERILIIKLLEQQKKKPEYLEKLGIRINMTRMKPACDERRRYFV